MTLNHFTLDEFKCSCCGVNYTDPEFIRRLDKARDFAGVPFVVTSGYRCAEHNGNVGGSPTSSHLKGVAADLSARDSVMRVRIVRALMAVGFERIGVSDSFIHVDEDTLKPEKVMWRY